MKEKLVNEIRSFIVENFLYGEADNGLQDKDSLTDMGIIDSTGVLELVSHIETTYDFRMDDDELIPENLDSIAKVAAYIQRKQDAATD